MNLGDASVGENGCRGRSRAPAAKNQYQRGVGITAARVGNGRAYDNSIDQLRDRRRFMRNARVCQKQVEIIEPCLAIHARGLRFNTKA